MRFPRLAGVVLIVTLGMGTQGAWASHPPTLAVHESLFGTETQGKKRYSVTKLTIQLYSREQSNSKYLVESFFLKRGASGASPQIDDTVLFTVTDPRSIYEVTAKPIQLPPPPKATKSKSSKKGSKKSSPKPPKFSQADYPREGYIVRVLCDGNVVRSKTSSHLLERLAKEHPALLDQAAAAKTARRPELEILLKK